VGAGVTLVFMLTIGSFVSILLLGGSDTLVLPLLIYQQISLLNNNFAAALRHAPARALTGAALRPGPRVPRARRRVTGR